MGREQIIKEDIANALSCPTSLIKIRIERRELAFMLR
jgi:hypothetical protein